MVVAMMQPSFLPWMGLFEFIHKADRFIILDDFQFSVQSWHQRNRLFLDKGSVGWYTVPVKKKGSFSSKINSTYIDERTNWRNKMWKRIVQNYSKASFFSDLSTSIEKWLLTPFEILGEQNISFIKLVSEICGIQTEFLYSSQHPSQLKRSERVLELLRWGEAHTYLASIGSFAYMYEDRAFPSNDLEILFQDFKSKPYVQTGSPDRFCHNLSVLDALFNIGPDETAWHIKNGTENWIPWKKMVEDINLAKANND